MACVFTKDLISARLIDDEHAESSDQVSNEKLINDLLNDLRKGIRTIHTISTFTAGSTIPTRNISNTTSLLMPMLFGMNFNFDNKSPHLILTNDNTITYASLLNATAIQSSAIFIDTIDTDKTCITCEMKALEKAKLLACMSSTTKLVEDAAMET